RTRLAMSDLDTALSLVGVGPILLVLQFAWCPERRVRRPTQEQSHGRQADPLLGPAPPPPAAVRREPGSGPITANAGDSDPSEDADDPAEVDPATEVVIDISFAQPVPSEQLHAATHAVRRVGTKPVRMFAEREGGGHRARLRAGEEYASMQLAVL